MVDYQCYCTFIIIVINIMATKLKAKIIYNLTNNIIQSDEKNK